MGSKVKCLPLNSVCLFCRFVHLSFTLSFLLIVRVLRRSVLIGRSGATCGPAGHTTERSELGRSQAPLPEPTLPHIVTPLAAVVAAQRHRQAQDGRTRTRTGTGTGQVQIRRWVRGFQAFLCRFGGSGICWIFQQTSKGQV